MATIDTPRAIRVKTSTGWADLAIAGAPGPQGVQGPAGGTGPQGVQGPAGPGVPVGGVNGQALVKKSSTDFDTQWAAAGADLVYDGDYTSGPTFKDGEIVVYNGIAYICTSPTTSPPSAWPGGPAPQPTPKPSYGTSLPVSPIDGQEAILVDSVTNPTYSWRFRYNAGSSSAYKWECIGGAPVSVYGGGIQSTNSAYPTYVELSTASPKFTVPRAGDYACSYTGNCDNDTAGGNPMATMGFGPAGGASTTKDGDLIYARPPATTTKVILARSGILLTGVPAGQVIRMLLCSFSGGTSSLERASISVQPVRVS